MQSRVQHEPQRYAGMQSFTTGLCCWGAKALCAPGMLCCDTTGHTRCVNTCGPGSGNGLFTQPAVHISHLFALLTSQTLNQGQRARHSIDSNSKGLTRRSQPHHVCICAAVRPCQRWRLGGQWLNTQSQLLAPEALPARPPVLNHCGALAQHCTLLRRGALRFFLSSSFACLACNIPCCGTISEQL